ncbi:MAG: D-alanine--D-alanine ligase [Mariprofundaceae bacterium]|nr:D-alanine--D-alanine ligase [Mariprofundaceae bacterium]
MTMPVTVPFSRVGVLMGGSSSEREISLRSGRAVSAALKRSGIQVTEIDLSHHWPEQIRSAEIDAAFIALHGTLGEDGAIQGLLEIMGIPYTGSGITASALCMHKQLSKSVLEKAGIKTPVEVALNRDGPLRYPVVLKPVAEGSSVGLHFLNAKADWDALDITNPAGWMAEMPVNGPEIHVSTLNGKALPPVEIVPKSGVYDYASKYTVGATQYFCPARIPAETLRLCMQRAEEAVEATGCDGAPRVDMIVADGGEPVILEINTIPGMTETSLLPKAAAQAGIGFDELCCLILAAATLDSNRGLAS